jgi:stage III sporulation protein SpoIIIAA
MLSLIQEAKQMIGVSRSEFMRQALTEKLEKLSLIKSKPRKGKQTDFAELSRRVSLNERAKEARNTF